MNQTFLDKYKVFLSGLAGAIALAMTEFLGKDVIDWKVIGFAVLMATLSYIANQWRGQGVTILGIVGTLAYSFVSLQNTGTFTWQQFILSSAVAILAAVAPPAKSLGYEKTATIQNAKAQGDAITKSNAPSSVPTPPGIILVLIGIGLLMSSCAQGQSFFKPLPKKQNMQKGYSVSPTGQSTMNAFRPAVNLVSYSVPGNRLMTGVGAAYEHLLWDDAKQKWQSQWSINALAWYFVPLSSNDPTNGKTAYGVSIGFFNNLILIGAATDGTYGFGTVGIGIALNN